ncbi:MAG: LUD domain-containing protein, partial [Dongia sp.]
HIVLTSIEKVVPTVEDAMTLLRVLPRSATGQELSVYVTFSTGPRRATDLDGPREFHVVLLDNGRSAYLGGPMQDMLRCIRCGACMDHCPVYHSVGGHAYGWVYPGPIGAILTPALIGVQNAEPLPHASSLCGRCEAVCPVRIPIPKLLRHWRDEEFSRHMTPAVQRFGLGLWAWFAKRPPLYRLATRWAMRVLRVGAGNRGRFQSLPLAGGWTRHRDFPAPQGGTFHDQWRARRGGGGR